MSERCPVCKRYKLERQRGMGAKDGRICGACWKEINSISYGRAKCQELTLAEIRDIIAHRSYAENAGEGKAKAEAQTWQLESSLQESLSKFRRAYAGFFGNSEQAASELQEMVTPFFWQLLQMKKQRLEKKQVMLQAEVPGKEYWSKHALNADFSWNGKLEMGLVRESAQDFPQYFSGKQELLLHKGMESAYYQLAGARKLEEGGKYSCPGCGVSARRGKLLDGCPSCGRKFTEAELQIRIYGFGQTKEYELPADNSFTAKKLLDSMWKIGVVTFGIVLVESLVMSLAGDSSLSISDCFIRSVVSSVLMGILGGLVYGFIIIPFTGTSMSLKKKKQSLAGKLEQLQAKNSVVEGKIRAEDPLFSRESFFAVVRNRLELLHYADDWQQVKAFWHQENGDEDKLEINLKVLLRGYKDVIAMRTEELMLTAFAQDEEYQRLEVGAKLQLWEESEGQVNQRLEKLQLVFVRQRDCLSELEDGSAFLTCSSCGAALSLKNGAQCSHCGQAADLAELDWAIADWQAVR